MKDRKKMPMSVFFALKPGDKFVAHWAKDDDPQYTRINYELFTVDSNDGNTLLAGVYDWSRSDVSAPLTMGGNELDTSRGIATFFYPPKRR